MAEHRTASQTSRKQANPNASLGSSLIGFPNRQAAVFAMDHILLSSPRSLFPPPCFAALLLVKGISLLPFPSLLPLCVQGTCVATAEGKTGGRDELQWKCFRLSSQPVLYYLEKLSTHSPLIPFCLNKPQRDLTTRSAPKNSSEYSNQEGSREEEQG